MIGGDAFSIPLLGCLDVAAGLQTRSGVFKKLKNSSHEKWFSRLANDLGSLEKRWNPPKPASLLSLAESEPGYLPTGIESLPKVLGCKGYPLGRIVEIFGTESSGKTTMALQAIAAVNAMGGHCAFVDIENGLNESYALKLGVDAKKCLVIRPTCAEHAFDAIELLLKSKHVALIVLDSVAALSSKNEKLGNLSDEKFDGHQAKMISARLRRLSSYLAQGKTTLIFVNQLREHFGEDGKTKEVSPGGHALKFYASIRLALKKGEMLQSQGGFEGHKTKVTTVKNRYFKPHREHELKLVYGEGFKKEERFEQKNAAQ